MDAKFRRLATHPDLPTPLPALLARELPYGGAYPDLLGPLLDELLAAQLGPLYRRAYATNLAPLDTARHLVALVAKESVISAKAQQRARCAAGALDTIADLIALWAATRAAVRARQKASKAAVLHLVRPASEIEAAA